mmetsp:Transcript_6120/g.13840  ORF Transcript_6120/g.13840 Transcript_6120/m.13840 type:complete len:305 (-) Transcript_6120:2516-3430(-)
MKTTCFVFMLLLANADSDCTNSFPSFLTSWMKSLMPSSSSIHSTSISSFVSTSIIKPVGSPTIVRSPMKIMKSLWFSSACRALELYWNTECARSGYADPGTIINMVVRLLSNRRSRSSESASSLSSVMSSTSLCMTVFRTILDPRASDNVGFPSYAVFPFDAGLGIFDVVPRPLELSLSDASSSVAVASSLSESSTSLERRFNFVRLVRLAFLGALLLLAAAPRLRAAAFFPTMLIDSNLLNAAETCCWLHSRREWPWSALLLSRGLHSERSSCCIPSVTMNQVLDILDCTSSLCATSHLDTLT